MRDLNLKVKTLRKIIQRNWHKTKLEELDADDLDDLKDGERHLDFFLWKVCLHETHQVELAATVVTDTRLALLTLLQQAGNGPFFQWITANATMLLMPPNAWLFLRARTRMRELKTAFGPLVASMRHERLRPPTGEKRDPDPSREKLPENGCILRSRGRGTRSDKEGKLAERKTDHHCGRACDLLLLVELGFRVREVALTLDSKKSTVSEQTEACRVKAKGSSDQGPSAGGPAGNKN